MAFSLIGSLSFHFKSDLKSVSSIVRRILFSFSFYFEHLIFKYSKEDESTFHRKQKVFIYLFILFIYLEGSPNGSAVNNLPVKQEAWVRSLGQEDPLEKEMATHPSILAWENPWTEEPYGLQSIGLKELDNSDTSD